MFGPNQSAPMLPCQWRLGPQTRRGKSCREGRQTSLDSIGSPR